MHLQSYHLSESCFEHRLFTQVAVALAVKVLIYELLKVSEYLRRLLFGALYKVSAALCRFSRNILISIIGCVYQVQREGYPLELRSATFRVFKRRAARDVQGFRQGTTGSIAACYSNIESAWSISAGVLVSPVILHPGTKFASDVLPLATMEPLTTTLVVISFSLSPLLHFSLIRYRASFQKPARCTISREYTY